MEGLFNAPGHSATVIPFSMRDLFKKTAFLYIIKEITPIFLISLMTFTVIILMDKILKMIEMIVSRGVGLGKILQLLFFLSPSFLVFTIPMAFLVGTLLTFGRLSGDSEITAFKASGISLYQLFFPILLFSVAAYLLTTFLVIYGLPWGNRGFKATLYLIAQTKADVEVKERIFNDAFDGLVVYVEKVPIQGKKMEGILIYDERDKEKLNTIFARDGFLISNPQTQSVTLRLRDGDIHRYEPKAKTYQRARFETYDLKLELAKAFTAFKKRLRPHEMSIDELHDEIVKKQAKGQEVTDLYLELHKRFAIPFSCVVFGLVGVPLGIQPRRSGRSYGFVFSILIILGYYIALTTFEMFAMRKIIPPFVACWAPNLLFGSLGVYLLVMAAREASFKPLLWIVETMDLVQRKVKALVDNA
jgi:lipopolysaccharide export system permease protein